jgi:hypothetical protein
MRKLRPDDPVPKPAEGRSSSLTPTTTVIGDGAEVRLGEGTAKVDWEIEGIGRLESPVVAD